jgi:hypothetical protein
MELTTFFGMLAGALALAEIYPYATSIVGVDLRFRPLSEGERTIPNLATWIIFSVEGGIIAFSYYARSDIPDFWFFAALTVNYLIAAILSIRYGEHVVKKSPPFTRLDLLCLTGAVLSLLLWYQYDSWEIPIVINMVIDSFGIVPTLEKIWRQPKTEDMRAWSMTMVSSVLSVCALGALSTWSFERAGFPLYMVFVNGGVLLFMMRRYV